MSAQPLILAVDDEKLTLMMLRDALGFWGFAADTAHDGVEALERVAERAPDLILLDWRMPRMGGGEALPLLREACDAPIIVLSAFVPGPHRNEIIAAKPDAFLAKPYDLDVLEALIRSHLGVS